jgi:hypothetical protein
MVDHIGKNHHQLPTLEMGFRDSDGKRIVLRGMSIGAPMTVSAKRMESIFRHGEVAYDVECLITTWKDSEGPQHYQREIRNLLGRHRQVSGSIPPSRPPNKGFEHTIELEEGAKPMITSPYRHPRRFKDEIEKAIKELLAMGHIRPSISPFASSVGFSSEEGWYDEDVRRLPGLEQENHQEPISYPLHL